MTRNLVLLQQSSLTKLLDLSLARTEALNHVSNLEEFLGVCGVTEAYLEVYLEVYQTVLLLKMGSSSPRQVDKVWDVWSHNLSLQALQASFYFNL